MLCCGSGTGGRLGRGPTGALLSGKGARGCTARPHRTARPGHPRAAAATRAAPYIDRLVLDTSVFTNPAVYVQFGPDTLSAIAAFVALARRAQVECSMPGSVYDELRLMKQLDRVASELEAVVRIRSPRRHQLQLPASIVYELIEEVRHRIDRGLRIAEEHAKMGREPGSQ